MSKSSDLSIYDIKLSENRRYYKYELKFCTDIAKLNSFFLGLNFLYTFTIENSIKEFVSG